MEQADANIVSIINKDVIQAAEKTTDKPHRDRKGPYTTSLGVVLKYRKVPSQLLFKAWSNLKVPEVPMVWIEEHGRHEPHPYSPSYLEEMGQYRHNRAHLTTYIYFMRGLDVFEIPAGVTRPESDDWFAGLEEVLEIDKLKGQAARQTAWLMYYAIPSDEEQAEIIQDLMILSGFIAEEVVDEALDSFRDNEGSEGDQNSKGESGDSN